MPMRFFTRLLFSVLPLVVIPPVIGVVLMMVRANAIIADLMTRQAELELEAFRFKVLEEHSVLQRLGIQNADFYRANAQRNALAYAETRSTGGVSLHVIDVDGEALFGSSAHEAHSIVREAPVPEWGWTLSVAVSPELVSIELRRTSGYLLFLVALIVVPLTVVLSLLTRRVSYPIEELERTAARLAAGDLAERTEIVRRDEIGSLARTFNRMAESLEENTRGLESQVAERTQALQRTVEELEAAQDELVRSERMAALGGLVAGMAHQINTPIGVGVTSATFLRSECQRLLNLALDEEIGQKTIAGGLRKIAESSELVYRNLKRAEEHVQRFQQLAIDQTTEQKREFAFPDYLDETLAALRPILEDTDVTVSVDCSERVVVTSHPGHFYQIFTNLVLNSLAHGFRNTGVGSIRIVVAKSGDDLQIRYIDDGVGMSSDQAARVFEPFFTTARTQGGTGLGMSIVYNIVTEQLGGQIELSTKPGEGVAFEILLPQIATT
jgi:signal transduction histidine kinase